MTSTIKVNNIQNQCGANIINESSNTITIGASGDTISLAAGASQTGFGRTGTVDWDTTPKTASFNATSGDGFFCNTTSSAFTATLPSGAAGAIVSFADYAGTWQTNTLIVSPQSGEKIGGAASNVVLNTEGQSVTFVYVDSTQGWVNIQDSTSNERGEAFITATGGTITECGNFKIHTFTAPGTFTVCSVADCAANNEVSHVVVAGGGGSGSKAPGGPGGTGGGGAGGYRESKSPVDSYTSSPLEGGTAVTVTATAYPITVGAGGAGGAAPGNIGTNGVNSVFSTITSAGGGGGSHSPSPADGAAGGSGGGGNGGNSTSGGAGNTPPVSPSQGNGGGNAGNGGGGGGGATSAGENVPGTNCGGYGGAGATTLITGTPTAYGGGGGGGGYNGNPAGTAGSGGGGAGTTGPNAPVGADGTANTGGGAGGTGGPSPGSALAGASGGSGIVIIRYKFQ